MDMNLVRITGTMHKKDIRQVVIFMARYMDVTYMGSLENKLNDCTPYMEYGLTALGVG